ncbi:MAG: TatD family hydrolase [Muribaculaceae bacterium]|nr:TatD family hydrolase [Muribaculaceae bacterium]
MNILDFHTHQTDATDALIAVDPRRFDPLPGHYYAVGFHPWETVETITEEDFMLLERCARHPQVLAIGETGMDHLRGGGIPVQTAVFIRHLQVANETGLPVVVHNVRSTRDILDARRTASLAAVPLAVHGMSGNRHVARTLLDAGCYLSFGQRFNPGALLETPLDRLLLETDDAPVTIHEVATLVAQTLHLTVDDVKTAATGNARKFLGINPAL